VACVRRGPAQDAHALAVAVKLQKCELLQASAVVTAHRGWRVVGVAAALLTKLLRCGLVSCTKFLHKHLNIPHKQEGKT
jgi:hypothetical protein